MKKAKRKRYLNNKALRKAQLIANPLPQAATPVIKPLHAQQAAQALH
jgi:hypothetical protein